MSSIAIKGTYSAELVVLMERLLCTSHGSFRNGHVYLFFSDCRLEDLFFSDSLVEDARESESQRERSQRAFFFSIPFLHPATLYVSVTNTRLDFISQVIFFGHSENVEGNCEIHAERSRLNL